MTTETLPSYVDSHTVDSESDPVINESTSSSGDANRHTGLEDSEQKVEFQQIFFFLTYTLKESIQQTLYSLLQDLKCTYLLLRQLHKPYVDTIRVLIPLWMIVLHIICLVILMLVHKISNNAIARFREAARPSTPTVQALQDPKPQGQLSKSRTLGVFSGITASFSLTSLIPSRRTSNSSTASSVSGTHTAHANTPLSKASVVNRLPFSRSGRLSLGSRKSDTHLSQDPSLVYIEQPSTYWTGRFLSLHDKLQSECLTHENLQSLLSAQSERSAARNQQRQPQLAQDTRYTRYNTRLPPSTTSAAILQQTGGGDMSTQSLTAQAADAALLLDDDERCRRVFIILESLCANDEAQKSLLAWQQEFARRTGRKKLLPKGGTMEARVWGSYFSRMGVKRIGKRASIV